jgi:hypothetical protein
MESSMENSMENLEAEKKEYNYIIGSHVAIFTSLKENEKKYMAIKIPENVELFTYTTFGKVVATSCRKNYFICDNLEKVQAKYNNLILKIEKPTHKYKYKEDTKNIFPEVMLIPDEGPILKFYSGIIHCIPHANRSSSIKGMEIIHNMDANNAKDCSDDSIRKYYKYADAEDKQKLYDTNTKYSEDYKKVIKKQGKKREAPLDTINKCGAILLSEAIKIIQAHCEKTYGANNTIKIYLSFCLGEMNIEEYGRGKKFYLREKDKVIEYMTQNNETLTQEQVDRLYYDNLDYYSVDTESIISNNLHATNLEEFAENLDSDYVAEDIPDSFSYDYVYDTKHFKLIFSKKSAPKLNTARYHKYDIVNEDHYMDLVEGAIRKLLIYIFNWHIDYSALPNNITIDVTEFEQPTKDNIFKKLIHTLTLMVEKLQTTLKFNSKKKTWQLVVNLLHDDYLENENKEYDNKIFSVIKRIFELIQTSYENMLSKIVNFNLKLSVLKESEDALYERMKQQIIEQSYLEKAKQAEATQAEAEAAAARDKEVSDLAKQEAAAAHQKNLITLAREEAAQAEKAEAEKAEAEKAEAEKAEAEKAAAEKAARKAARKAAKKAAREAEEEAAREAVREAAREAAEEAKKAEKEAEEEAKKAEKEAKTKRSLSKRLMSTFTRSSRRVAPEPENMTTSNSQTKKRSMTQRFKSIFNPRSTRVAPAPHNAIASGIKTKFKRKHKRKITRRITRRHRIKNISRNRPLYKIKTHSISNTYGKKTFKKPITSRRKK